MPKFGRELLIFRAQLLIFLVGLLSLRAQLLIFLVELLNLRGQLLIFLVELLNLRGQLLYFPVGWLIYYMEFGSLVSNGHPSRMEQKNQRGPSH
ncbi:hypothetical protein MUB24_14250 [Lederbergia sp. NSJ-179]|uniref:hypothetical protein n=1 Tax=Lederbergia sp. NSJ-179 TaxID=2931402 RepID=UPI001FD4DE77|nr:hypothetical protein [Lederbergia sp. NSJ-179]MCJ7842042.1 hypothetical protein [Lederbergia sp. NSJ-179]